MSQKEKSELPEGWAPATLKDIGSLFCGQSPASSTVNTEGQGMPYVSGPEQWDGTTLYLNKWTSEPARIVPDGTVFVTVKGAGVGTVFRGAPCAIGRDIYAFLPEPGIQPTFITNALRFTTGEIVARAQGDIPGLSKDHILNHSLLVPPSGEQRRIADALDELLSDLDAGIAALERVRDKLKLYRAAVLKAAVEGALTAEWRKQHPQTESASELLKRILAERRRRWEEEQLRKFKEKGREPPASWKAKYNEPVAPDTTDLPPIPEGWCWASFEQVSMRVTVGHVGPMRDEYVETGIPFLRNQNVRENKFDPEGLLFITPEFHARLAKSTIHPGDIAVVRSGAVGVSCMIPDALHEANCADLVLIQRPVRILPHYGAYYLNSAAKMDIRRGQVGIALIHFNTKSVAALAVAVPPVAEQELIVEAVEDQLSIIDHLESDLDTKLKTAHALHQSILRHAFSGKLVPQDPNDEPAFELLKRIAAEREQRTREAAAAKRLNGHQPRRASKPRGTAARVTSKASQHGRIADR